MSKRKSKTRNIEKQRTKESPLVALISRSSLQRLAGARSFERGERYFLADRVGEITEYKDAVKAPVQGTRRYTVKLWPGNGSLEYSCTCPVGEGYAFCKHCVAVGFAWIEKQQEQENAENVPPTMDDVRDYLQRLDKDTLLDMLMEQAFESDHLRQQLMMKVAVERAGAVGVGGIKQLIDNAVDVGDYVEYGAAHDIARNIDAAIDPIADLLKQGHAAEAVELSEYAFKEVEEAIEYVDDSDGYFGLILDRIESLHLAACKKAKPDAEALAERLFDLELNADYGGFSGAVGRYAKVLGKNGLVRYRALAEELWSQVPERGPDNHTHEEWVSRHGITTIMKALARVSGDLNELIAVMSRDLSSSYDFLQIAEACKAARKWKLALEWAERGVKEFPVRTDSRLREFLADQYHRVRRHDEAMAIIWAEFTEAPSLERYKLLMRHANRIKDWPAWREQAIAYVREHVAKEKSRKRRPWEPDAGHSFLVEVFLWEKDVDNAWQEANEGGCHDALWRGLAEKRSKDHPADAIPVYQRLVDPIVAMKNNSAYAEAAALIWRIRDLMTRAGCSDQFPAYLEAVRAAHKPKRNFMKLLNRLEK